MQINEVIRKYRKERGLTQEEIATRLGVTASAVNKWEKGNSYPDISLLAPIARLLGISLDTLLSFREELTTEEINALVQEINERLQNEPYEDAFQWMKDKIAMYPNCDQLIWQLTLIADVWRCSTALPESEKYDSYILSYYERVLDSQDEDVKKAAADSLFGFYLRKEQYEKAESYLVYFSKQNPERKRKQAVIYSKTNRIDEAYKACEELLFSEHNMLSLVFHSVYMLAKEEQNLEKALYYLQKNKQMTELFEMGEYQNVTLELEIAVERKDVDKTLVTMERLFKSIGEIDTFSKSRLYEHMKFKSLSKEFVEEMKRNLAKGFQEDESFEFVKEDERWEEILSTIQQ